MTPGSAHGTRRTWSLLGALFALAFVTSCESGITKQYRVSGYVNDLATGDGVGGVDITFTSDTRRTGHTRTAGNGAYQLDVRSDVAFGQVRAEKSGFTTDERTVYFDSTERRVDLGVRVAP